MPLDATARFDAHSSGLEGVLKEAHDSLPPAERHRIREAAQHHHDRAHAETLVRGTDAEHHGLRVLDILHEAKAELEPDHVAALVKLVEDRLS